MQWGCEAAILTFNGTGTTADAAGALSPLQRDTAGRLWETEVSGTCWNCSGPASSLWAPHSSNSLCGSVSQRSLWGLGEVWLLAPWDPGRVLQAEVREEPAQSPSYLWMSLGAHIWRNRALLCLSPCPKHVLRAHLIQRTVEGIFFLKCIFLYRGPAKSLLVTKGWAERLRWRTSDHEKSGVLQPGEGSKETSLWAFST